jgi:hypothetical protein
MDINQPLKCRKYRGFENVAPYLQQMYFTATKLS